MEPDEVDALIDAVNVFKARKAERVVASEKLAAAQDASSKAVEAVDIAEGEYAVADSAEDAAADALIALVQAEAA